MNDAKCKSANEYKLLNILNDGTDKLNGKLSPLRMIHVNTEECQKKKEFIVNNFGRQKILPRIRVRYRMTTKRLLHFIRWINLFKVWRIIDSPSELYAACKSGIFLCKIISVLSPSTKFHGLNMRVVTKIPALSNIEQVLAVIWQHPVITANMPNVRLY